MTNIRNAFSAAIGLTLLGSSLLLGAGVATAATCPAGQHWNEMGGGSGFCSPDASGGGTGGNGVYTGTGGNITAPQAPVFNAPAPYKPPVYGPAPAPAPIPAAPRPAAPAPAQQAPSIQIPAPAQNHAQAPNIQLPAAPTVQEHSPNSVSEVARNEGSSDHSAVIAEAPKNKDASTEVKSETKPEDKASVEKSDAKSAPSGSAKATADATSTPSPSASETAASPAAINASQASAVEPIMNAALVIYVVSVFSYLTWGLVIKPRLNRKSSETDESWVE